MRGGVIEVAEWQAQLDETRAERSDDDAVEAVACS